MAPKMVVISSSWKKKKATKKGAIDEDNITDRQRCQGQAGKGQGDL
jgi:hypothetical protein